MSLEEKILNAENILFKTSDIERITEYKTNIIRYSDLENVNNIDDILHYDACIILYQKTNNSGHWISIFKARWEPNLLYFFDPYGFQIDQEIKYSDFQLSRHNNKIIPHLTRLIQMSNYKIQSNNIQYQGLSNNINTCGRWASHRLLHRNLTPKQYYEYMYKNKYYTPDFWVSLATIQNL